MAGQFKERLGVSELTAKNNNMWKALLAEFIGNLILNFFGCASVVNVVDPNEKPNIVLIALTFGLCVFIIVQTFGHVSGAHVNPAVTLGMMAAGRCTIIKGALYVVAQCAGALAGSGVLKALTPEDVQDSLGATSLQVRLEPLQGFGVEFLLGFLLVVVVFGVCDENMGQHAHAASGALAIGMAVAIGHLATVDYTGSSMNPARSFGSAVIANSWDHHWVYWVGPCLGGIAAALLYTHAFAAPTQSARVIERYTAVQTEEKELKRLDGNGSKNDVGLA